MKFSSIVGKLLMAITGALWIAFAIAHLSGNFLLFSGPERFNAYPELLAKTGVLLWLAEAALALFLATHVVTAVRVTKANRAARPIPYAVRANAGSSTFASRTMAMGGIVLLIFLVTHIYMFKFGDHANTVGGLWGLVRQTFSRPLMVAWYLLAMIALGLHASHGLSSAFQSSGLMPDAFRARFRVAGRVFGWAIALGFMSFPIWAFVTRTN